MNPLATRISALTTACLLLLLIPLDRASAQSAAAACPLPALAPVLNQAPDRSGMPIEIRADALDAQSGELGQVMGNVEVVRGDQYLATELLQVRPDTRLLTLPGNMTYRDAQVTLQASNGLYGFNDEAGDFNDIRFSIVGSTAQGAADQVHIQTGQYSILDNGWFTTCPGESPDWLLQAKQIDIRHATGVGIARGAKLKLGKVPVLYLPYMTFPIDDRRKSGFLYPRFSTANDNGLEFGIPYYWNIAPNQDLTLTPRYFTERGFMLTNEYRFLTRRLSGSVAGDFLLDDDETGENRWYYKSRLVYTINRNWRGQTRLEGVSDNEYFQDFGGGLAATSRQYLRRNAGINGVGRFWVFSMLFDDFQVIDDAVSPSREPYRRLPRAAFRVDMPLGRKGLEFNLDSEAVYFSRDTGVTGARVDLYPNLAWNENGYWGFFRASGGYRYTTYNLDLDGTTGDESPDRGLPIVSLDGGLYFERDQANGNRQTLEPRLFYLYVPYEDQSQLPDFDTGEFTFGFAQLFHYNRFTGADRQTNANQLTIAASTRSISARDGRDVWSLNFGQIVYFDHPRVTLDDSMAQDLNTSPFIAEFNWSPLHRLNTRLALEYDWEDSEVNVGVVGLDHTSSGGHRLGFEYRFRRDRLDQFDVRYFWPISPTWKLFSRVNYSLEDSELLEGLVGVEYESCCWALRVAGRRYLRDRNGGTRDAIYVELRLKGLGSVGRRTAPLFYTPANN